MCNRVFQYVNLRTRYSELMTLTSQYIKFILETQRRLEEEEVNAAKHTRRHTAAGFWQNPANVDSLSVTSLWLTHGERRKRSVSQYSNNSGSELTLQRLQIVPGLENAQWWSKLVHPSVPAHGIHDCCSCLSFLNTVVMPNSQNRLSALRSSSSAAFSSNSSFLFQSLL